MAMPKIKVLLLNKGLDKHGLFSSIKGHFPIKLLSIDSGQAKIKGFVRIPVINMSFSN